eukprot:169464-Alexandrium_andersonii.AAC.1
MGRRRQRRRARRRRLLRATPAKGQGEAVGTIAGAAVGGSEGVGGHDAGAGGQRRRSARRPASEVLGRARGRE